MVSLATFNGLPQLPSLESLGLLKLDASSLSKKMFECTPISSRVTLVKQPMHDIVSYSNVANQGAVRSTASGLKRGRPPSQNKAKPAKAGKVSFPHTNFFGMLSLHCALSLALLLLGSSLSASITFCACFCLLNLASSYLRTTFGRKKILFFKPRSYNYHSLPRRVLREQQNSLIAISVVHAQLQNGVKDQTDQRRTAFVSLVILSQ